ncbi:MAG TPA: YciI family protein [Luteolibacter sp.]
MRYGLFIILSDPEKWESLSFAERNEVHAECGAWHEVLETGGHAVFAAAFQSPAASVTLRRLEGKVVIADGPFPENPFPIGGFEVIECDSIDEAISFAERFPALRAGYAVEVRPSVIDGCKD